MKRDLDRLSNEQFDLLVVGGGINGAFIAWDAALRGLRVALIEKSDFMGGTSANSLKILHGGLRYLQDLRFDLARKMIRERSQMMRLAPHLVTPLPFVLPTRGLGLRSWPVMSAAMHLNNLLSVDRNLGLPEDLQLPPGRRISKREFLKAFPQYRDDEGVDGAILWVDGLIKNTERFGLSVLKSAADQGAVLANYVGLKKIILGLDGVEGASLVDSLTGNELQVQCRVVLNATGSINVPGDMNENSSRIPQDIKPSAAFNVLIDRLEHDWALGIDGKARDREHTTTQAEQGLIFIVPWDKSSMIGTIHIPIEELSVGSFEQVWQRIDILLGRVSSQISSSKLKRDDVRLVHQGNLPTYANGQKNGKVRLLRNGRIVDHGQGNAPGLFSVLGVKFTCARHLAEKAVDIVAERLEVDIGESPTKHSRVNGGDIDNVGDYIKMETSKSKSWLPPHAIADLIYEHGTQYREVLKYANGNGGEDTGLPVGLDTLRRARIRLAIHEEMAQNLADVVFRRLGIAADGCPQVDELAICAEVMAAECGWSEQERDRQLDEVATQLNQRMLVNS